MNQSTNEIKGIRTDISYNNEVERSVVEKDIQSYIEKKLKSNMNSEIIMLNIIDNNEISDDGNYIIFDGELQLLDINISLTFQIFAFISFYNYKNTLIQKLRMRSMSKRLDKYIGCKVYQPDDHVFLIKISDDTLQDENWEKILIKRLLEQCQEKLKSVTCLFEKEKEN